MLNRDSQIQKRAYALWEKLGSPHGADWDHWLAAEREVDRDLMASFKPKKGKQKKAKRKKAA